MKPDSDHMIVQQVEQAKTSSRAADQLIIKYMPFIKAETAKFLRRPPVEGHDDELSIAMIAFHEAVTNYSKSRGAFLKYAALLISSRLIDYRRKEARHQNLIYMDEQPQEGEVSIKDTLADEEDHAADYENRNAVRQEIAEFSVQLQQFDIGLSDVADNCPKQSRTLAACQNALQYAKDNPHLFEKLLQTKRLPIAELSQGSGTDRKTLERHRKYMIALMLICTNGYEYIRAHVGQLGKRGSAK